MAGTWAAPVSSPSPSPSPSMAPVVVIQTNGSGTEAPANQSDRISRRIHDVAGLLFVNICNAPNNDSAAFFNLCISLARCIDFAIAHEEVPSKAGVLLSLLKKVCQCKNNNLLQAAIMVLMISAKNACQSGWFSDRDSEELRILFKEMRSNFCTVSNLITEPSSSVSIIPAIMSRFYPTMRMGHIFASLEIKPGYGAFMDDFRISKNTISSPDGIRLFVVQTDNMETSSCLISPPKVNFLMNGEGVERRMNVYADSGPKNPTDVTRMLICGSNLLQAVGEFNGNYIIAVAFVSVRSTPSGDALEHYVQPAPATIDSGPSRISLNCPISLNRIKTPVKGHSCKHLQCFDFENYVSINSRRPSWRCPHCNLHTCFTDIRIDQKMVEILKEVGKNVTKVIVSSDGSWNAVTEIDDNEKMEDMASNLGQVESACPESGDLDLTMIDDRIDSNNNHETEDRKLLQTACENQSTTQNLVIDPQVANTNYINRNSVHVENDFTVGWGPNVSAPQITSVFGSTPNNFYSSSVSTDAITSAPYREAETLHANMHHATSGSQNLIPLPNTLPLQFQYGNPSVSSEHGRLLSTTEHVNRTPIAFQALPAQTPVPVLQQISRNYMNTLIPDTPSATPQVSPAALWNTNGFSKVPCDGGRQQQFSRSHSNQLEVSQMASSSVPQYPGIQNVGIWALSQPPSTYQGPSLESMSRRMSQAMYQSLGLIQPSLQPNANFSQPQVHQRGPHRGIGQSTGASGSHQALNNSLGSIQSSMQTNVNFSQPHVHQRGPQSGIGQATGAIGSHQAMNSALGSIQSTMPLNANFLQPQVHQRGPQSGTGQATGATGNHQAMKHSLGSMGPQSGTGQATGVTGNHQAMKHSLGSMQSSMQLNANFSKPQVHERGPQSGIGQATGATGSHQAMNYSLGSIQSSLQSNADLSQPQVHPRGPQSGTDRATGAIGSQQDRLTIAAQRNVNAQVTRPLETSRMMPMFQISADGCRVPSPGGASLPVTRHDVYDPTDQNWRPTGRMRGALSGQAYSDALNQFIIQPTQQAQAARLVNVTAPSSSIQTPIQALVANRTAQDPGASNYSSVGPVTRSGDSGVSPWDYMR